MTANRILRRRCVIRRRTSNSGKAARLRDTRLHSRISHDIRRRHSSRLRDIHRRHNNKVRHGTRRLRSSRIRLIRRRLRMRRRVLRIS